MEQPKNTREQIGVVVLPVVKRAIAELAAANGRTVSNMTEQLILAHPDIQRKVAEINKEIGVAA